MSDIVVKNGTSAHVALVSGADFSGTVVAGKFINHGFIAIKKDSGVTLVPLSQISWIAIDDATAVQFKGIERSEPQKRAIAAAYSRKYAAAGGGGGK